jgi:type I restriction enzyme M protein
MLFDIVTANPPFSLDKWGHDEAEHDKFSRFRRGIPPKTKGDYAFILHMIETLKPGSSTKRGGRMGVVVPHGVLFRGSSEGKIRQKLIEENLLDAVIGLPEKLFYGTGIPAAILVFNKNKQNNSVLFIDASREFKSGKNQNQLTSDNIGKIVATYRRVRASNGPEIELSSPVCYAEEFNQNQQGVVVDKYAYLASADEIRENDYNLNIPRYVDTFEEEEEIDLEAVRKERQQLKAQLAELELEMDKYLKELGYGA